MHRRLISLHGGACRGTGSSSGSTCGAEAAPAARCAGARTARTGTESGGAESKRAGGRILASPWRNVWQSRTTLNCHCFRDPVPRGRVVKRDIEKALKEGVPQAAPAARAPVPMAPTDQEVLALFEEGSYEVVPHDGMRKIIAERLQVSKQTIPHFYLTITCELDNLLALRAKLNDRAPKDGDGKPAYKLSVNDFIIKALASGVAAGAGRPMSPGPTVAC